VRDLDIARAYMEAGVSRLIIGTIALTEPQTFAAICKEFPGRIGVSLDAVDGRLKTKGWVEDAGLTVFDVLPRLEADGAAFLIYTDIARDGMQTGVNLAQGPGRLEQKKRPGAIRALLFASSAAYFPGPQSPCSSTRMYFWKA